MTDDEQLTPEAVGASLAKAIVSVAECAADSPSMGSGAARDYAEAAERLANALAVTASMKG